MKEFITQNELEQLVISNGLFYREKNNKVFIWGDEYMCEFTFINNMLEETNSVRLNNIA